MRLLGRPLLAPALLLLTLLAGCGDPSSTSADPTPPGPTEPRSVAIVSQTAAGGTVDLVAVPVEHDADRQAFLAQFERGEMAEKVGAAIGSASVPDDYTLVGAVVAIGCDKPESVTAVRDGDGWRLEPQMPATPMQECFAPVTSVALVAVPAT